MLMHNKQKIASFDFFTKNQVALQLCCTFIISSFKVKPTFKNLSITLNKWLIKFISSCISH